MTCADQYELQLLQSVKGNKTMNKSVFYHWWLSSEMDISYSSYIMQKQSITFRNNKICFKVHCSSVGDNLKSIVLNQTLLDIHLYMF